MLIKPQEREGGQRSNVSLRRLESRKMPFRGVKKRSLVIFGCLLLCICISIVGGAVRSSHIRFPEKSGTAVINKTTALEVTTLELTSDGHIHLVLKNVSPKNLNGYVVALDDKFRITKDISSGDRVVPQNSTDDLEIPIQSTPTTIAILAAMFTDGSVEGDPTTVKEVRDWRLDLKGQLRRGLSALDEILESTDVDNVAALERLEAQLSSLPLDPANAGASSVRGLHDGKDALTNELNNLRSRQERYGSFNQRVNLMRLKERIKRRIASL
jgi:hypothetical protein